MTVEWSWSKVLNGTSKDIIIGQDKTQLLHAASSFMRQQSSGKYNVYLSKKTNKVEHNNTRQIKYLNKYYLFFTFAYKILFKYLHLLISSDFLFRRSLLFRNLIIHSFSVVHNGQILTWDFHSLLMLLSIWWRKWCYYVLIARCI